jgi:hypothetical protein
MERYGISEHSLPFRFCADRPILVNERPDYRGVPLSPLLQADLPGTALGLESGMLQRHKCDDLTI